MNRRREFVIFKFEYSRSFLSFLDWMGKGEYFFVRLFNLFKFWYSRIVKYMIIKKRGRVIVLIWNFLSYSFVEKKYGIERYLEYVFIYKNCFVEI